MNDPYNYTWGGSYSEQASGWTYAMTAADTTDVEDRGDFTYCFGSDLFSLRSIKFDTGNIGQNGSALRTRFWTQCGHNLTNWEFALTPWDIKYQWLASGNVTMGQRNCVGDVVIGLGGNTKGTCQGAG
jgi:hypothetical protein